MVLFLTMLWHRAFSKHPIDWSSHFTLWVIGAISAEQLRRFVGFMVLSSVGTLLIRDCHVFNTQAWSAALYYLVHSTLIATAFYFLFCGWMTRSVVHSGSFKSCTQNQNEGSGLTYFSIAMMMVGLPPISVVFEVFILGHRWKRHQVGLLLLS